MKGIIRLAQVLSEPNTDNAYRCRIRALDTGAIYNAIANPSPYRWECPELDALVYFLDAPYSKRVIGVLHDVDTSARSLLELATAEEQLPLALSGGDCYFGKYGRLSVPKTGDVDLSCHNPVHARLFLENETGLAQLSAYNLDFSTQGQPIHLYTVASKDGGMGDILAVDSNHVPSGATGDNAYTQTALRLDEIGNVSLSVGFTGASGATQLSPLAHMEMSVDGTMMAYCGATGATGPMVSLILSGADKSMVLSSAGTISMGSTGDTTLQAENFLVTAAVKSTGDFQIDGNFLLNGDAKVSATNVELEAKKIMLGGTDALAIVIAQKLVALFNAHTHPTTSPGAPSGPPMVPMTEVQIASVITKAK